MVEGSGTTEGENDNVESEAKRLIPSGGSPLSPVGGVGISPPLSVVESSTVIMLEGFSSERAVDTKPQALAIRKTAKPSGTPRDLLHMSRTLSDALGFDNIFLKFFIIEFRTGFLILSSELFGCPNAYVAADCWRDRLLWHLALSRTTRKRERQD